MIVVNIKTKRKTNQMNDRYHEPNLNERMKGNRFVYWNEKLMYPFIIMTYSTQAFKSLWCYSCCRSYLAIKRINDKLQLRWIYTFYTFLYNVIAILVLHTLQYMTI